MSKALPKELTSYDLLKTFAVVLMIVDHVGFYFFPEENWLRVFGRMCVPVWFFLIGYANSRDLSKPLWIGALVLICSDFIAGLYFFPFNILATMIIIRLLLDSLMERALRNVSAFWAINTLLFLLIIPTNMVLEYGTHGLILAIFGWLVRHKDDIKDKDLIHQYLAFGIASFVVIQYLIFGFDNNQLLVLVLGIFTVMAGLMFYKPAVYSGLTAAFPRLLVWFLQLTGRHTLLIYVGHLLLFKIMGMYLEPERFTFLEWSLFYQGLE